MTKLTDESIMAFGKYKGQKLANLPASYLLWLYDQGVSNVDLRNYIKDNLRALQIEANDAEG